MYRQNVSQVIDFTMVTTAGAADAAATINAKRILGMTLSSVVGNIINQSGGAYSLVMDSTDCNSANVGLYFTASGDVPLMITFATTTANPQDAAGFGLSRLDSTISSRMGATPLINNLANLDSTVSSRMGATPLINNLSNLDSAVSSRMGTFTLPTNFAALGLSSSGHVSNVDTLQIYTSNTPQSGNAFPSVNTGVAPGAAGGLLTLGSNAGAVVIASLAMGGSLSVGSLIIGGVSDQAQSGDAFARLGVAGVGLTNLGDARLANLDSTVSSRMGTFALPANFASLAITAGGAMTAGTVSAGAIGATSITTAGLNAIADALLDRNMATGTDSGTNSVRTVRQSLRTSRNKVDTGAGIVYKEDDTTTSYTFAVTTAAGNPITVFDPSDV